MDAFIQVFGANGASVTFGGPTVIPDQYGENFDQGILVINISLLIGILELFPWWWMGPSMANCVTFFTRRMPK